MKNITFKILISALALILLFNCTKEKAKYTVEEINGVKYYKNSGEPTGKYRPAVKLLFEIKGPENVPDSMKGFGLIADVLCDDLDNIYILDQEHATIKKYNRNGEFERYFPEIIGDGLDECIQKPSQFTIFNDTLVMYGQDKWVEYLTSGKYLNSKEDYFGGEKVLFLNSDGKNYVTAFNPKQYTDTVDSVYYFSNNLNILGRRYRSERALKIIKIPLNDDFFFPDALTSYTAKNDMFYIAENEGTDYKIYAKNGRTQLKYVIEKKYDKVPYNNFEKNELNKFIKLYGFSQIDSNKVYYKKPINSIEIDKNNKLWVMPSMERTEANQDSFYIDIFSEGIFINRTVLDFVKGNETYKLEGNRLYVIAADNKSIKVYDYE